MYPSSHIVCSCHWLILWLCFCLSSVTFSVIERLCISDVNRYSCYPDFHDQIARAIYGQHIAVGKGTSCLCKYYLCNNHPWDVLIQTKSGKVVKRKVSSESSPTHATETDAKRTDVMQTDVLKTDFKTTDGIRTGSKKTDLKMTDLKTTQVMITYVKPIKATTTAAIIREDPRREHVHSSTENAPNTTCVLHTKNQLPTIFTIMVHFIISLITQY